MNFDRERAMKSIVTVYRNNDATGMGVVALDGYILTAAHCLHKIPDSDDPYGDLVAVRFHPIGEKVDAQALVVAVDPCSDLAILFSTTAHGSTLGSKEVRKFDRVLDRLLRSELQLEETFEGTTIPVFIFTHKMTWISAEATIYSSEDRFFDLTTDVQCEPITPGTSGSPLFDKNGRVIGIVSSGSETEPNDRSATAVRLAMALPGWFLRLVRGSK